MGFQLTWCAIRSNNAFEWIESAGFQRTGAREELPESPFTVVTLRSGWVLLHATPPLMRLTNDAFLERVSRNSEAVCFFAHENKGITASAHWRDGRQVWTVRSEVYRLRPNETLGPRV